MQFSGYHRLLCVQRKTLSRRVSSRNAVCIATLSDYKPQQHCGMERLTPKAFAAAAASPQIACIPCLRRRPPQPSRCSNIWRDPRHQTPFFKSLTAAAASNSVPPASTSASLSPSSTSQSSAEPTTQLPTHQSSDSTTSCAAAIEPVTPAAPAPAPSPSADPLAALCNRITSLFPLWVVLGAGVALWRPEMFTWLPTGFITWGLAATMLGMGLTMRLSDFGAVFSKMPQLLLLGMVLQYTVMPGLGWLFSRHAGLPASLSVGIAVLSACPGGTASNIVAFLARGEMALSILMTAASTLAAVVATPAITAALAGTLVPVDAKGLFMSTMQVVLLPVLAGCAANQAFPAAVARVSRYTPAVATLLVAVIVGSTLATSAGAVRGCGPALLGAVAGLHASGFALGYTIARMLGLPDKICRTMSIEVGMQNSTLGAVLCALHFADPLTAAPCAVSACTHSVMGSALAAFWQRTTASEEQPREQQQHGQQSPSPAV